MRAAQSWTAPPARQRPVILMYHRIAERDADPWELCVAPQRFKRHLAFLQKAYLPLSVDELVARIVARTVPDNAVAITFDDGYRDNAVIAKPLLEQAGVPATFFLTTGAIGKGRPFWWDELWALLCAGPPKAEFIMDVAGQPLQVQWSDDQPATKMCTPWRAGVEPQTGRQRAYVLLWRNLKDLSPRSRDKALKTLHKNLGGSATPTWSDLDLPMSLEDAGSLPSTCISVGGHARTHHPLVEFDPARRWQEISGSRAEVAHQTGQLPTGFAYPHGNWNSETRTQVADAGYSWAVTTHRAAVMPKNCDPFALPRLAVGDWSAEQLRDEMEALRR